VECHHGSHGCKLLIGKFIRNIGSFFNILLRQPFQRKPGDVFILDRDAQMRPWIKANQKMGWGIGEEQFDGVGQSPEIAGVEPF
jgi:hypothetical protein